MSAAKPPPVAPPLREVVVAAIDQKSPRGLSAGPALRALAAALALPGLVGSTEVAAEDAEITFATQHYQEGERDLAGRSYANLNLHPIAVDRLALALRNTFARRDDFAPSYTQATWSARPQAIR